MVILKYISSVINLANSFSKATRPKKVGQLSDLIQEYRIQTTNPTVDGWKDFYIQTVGQEKIDDAADLIWDCITKMKENLEHLTKEDVQDWVNDLVIDKTFSGLQLQLDILKQISKESYRLATPEEEADGIDGYSDGIPVSIKPYTYVVTMQSTYENINHRLILYKETPTGLKIWQKA